MDVTEQIVAILNEQFGPGADESETAEALCNALADWTGEQMLRPDRAADHFAALASQCQTMAIACRADAQRMADDDG